MPADADLDMTLQTRAADRFDPLSEAERKLLAALPAGLGANCGPDGLTWDAPENDPARAGAWDHDRTIRAALLEWLCADAKAAKQIHHLGIRLTGARIDDVFELSFVNVPFPLSCLLLDDNLFAERDQDAEWVRIDMSLPTARTTFAR